MPQIEVYLIKGGEAPGGIGKTGTTAASSVLENIAEHLEAPVILGGWPARAEEATAGQRLRVTTEAAFAAFLLKPKAFRRFECRRWAGYRR
jgi:hypothetical protein